MNMIIAFYEGFGVEEPTSRGYQHSFYGWTCCALANITILITLANT